MTITVHGPSGITIDFPDGTDHATINGVMSQAVGQKAAPPQDQYQQAASQEQADMQAKGIDTGAGFTRRLAHGATLGADSTILAGLQAPLEAIKRGVPLSEGYNYAKAREDQIMNQSRENTGALGTAAEVLGGGVAAGGLANAGVTASRLLAPGAGLLKRAAASALDTSALGGFTGAMEGNGLQERGANALKGAAIGGLVGGGLPIVGSVAGALASPIVSNIRARINPEGYATSQVARAVSESGQTPQQIGGTIAQANAEGQPFTLADALGNPGQRMLSSVARAPGQGRTEAVNFLESRQAGQGRRVANALSEGFDAPQTAAQAERAMTAARDTAADAEYGAVRNGASQVDVVPALNNLDRNIGTGPGQAVTAANDSIEGALRPYRERLARVNPDDFEAVARIRGDMADAAQNARQSGYGNRARLIGQAVRELDHAMEAASPGYRAANANYSQASRDIEAILTGRQAATRGRMEDTIPAFQALGQRGQQGFRTGYVDPLIEQAQGAAVGVNKARPFTSDAFGAEANVMAPGNPLMQRRLGREMTMFETRNAALGGSKTADNLADHSALGVSPSLVRDIVTGNIGGAIRHALHAGSNVVSGNTPAVREAVGRLLLQRGTNPDQINRLVGDTIRRIQSVQAIARNLGRGAAGGLAVELPSSRRQ
jgi:hypothetical protein